MAHNRIALLRLRVEVADNGYVLEATYSTDRPNPEGWGSEETATTVHMDGWSLSYDVRSLLEAETARREALSAALEPSFEVVEHGPREALSSALEQGVEVVEHGPLGGAVCS